MKVIKFLSLFILFMLGVTTVNSQKQALIDSSDSLTLAQAFINLSLTAKYFDSINSGRIVKILAYEKQQVTDIKKVKFIFLCILKESGRRGGRKFSKEIVQHYFMCA